MGWQKRRVDAAGTLVVKIGAGIFDSFSYWRVVGPAGDSGNFRQLILLGVLAAGWRMAWPSFVYEVPMIIPTCAWSALHRRWYWLLTLMALV